MTNSWCIDGAWMAYEWLINDWLSHFNGISPTPIWWITDFKHYKRGWWSITLNQPGCLNSPWQAFSALQIFSIPSSFNTSTYTGSEHKENVQNLNIRYRIIFRLQGQWYRSLSHLLVHCSCEGHARLFHGLLAQHLSRLQGIQLSQTMSGIQLELWNLMESDVMTCHDT